MRALAAAVTAGMTIALPAAGAQKEDFSDFIDSRPVVGSVQSGDYAILLRGGASYKILGTLLGTAGAANPSATAGPAAINGSASTFMRSDGAPPIQLGTAAQKGIVQCDDSTITCSSGVISAIAPLRGTPGLGLGHFATPEDYGGSAGSTQAATGTTTASSVALTLASAADFRNGHGVLVVGAGVVQTGAVPTNLTVTPTGATGATNYAYRISTDDGSGGLSAAIAAVSIANGNATLTTTNYNALAWTAGAGASRYHIWVSKAAGAYTYIGSTALTAFNDTGSAYQRPFWVPATPNTSAQADFFTSTISSGGGGTAITLAAPATKTVSGAIVRHDDTAAIQAAITHVNLAATYAYGSGNPWPYYEIPAVQLADGGHYNISSALTTNAPSLALLARSNATIEKAGFLGNSISSSSLNRLSVQNISFAGGATSLSIGNSNIDNTLYSLNNVEFNGTTDYAIKTTGAYSAHLHCYVCNFAGVNGAIASDADIVDVVGGWSATHFLWFQLNRAWFSQTHTSYYNQILSATNHTGVPYQSDGITYIQGNRWFDVQGTLSSHGSRWGGEQAGIPVAYIQSTLSTATTPQTYQGPAVDIRGGWNFCGPTSGMTVNGCIVLNGIPASVSFDSTAGPASVAVVTDNMGSAVYSGQSGSGFANALARWKTLASITDAHPYIHLSLAQGAARSSAWPPAGNLFPVSFGPYLDNYHAAGSWSPTLRGSSTAGAPTYTVQVGDWEQNGGQVTAHFNITTTALGGTVGNMQIGALPVTAAAGTNRRGTCVIGDQNGITLDTNFTQLAGIVPATATAADLWEFKATAAGSGTQTPVSDYAAATRISGTCIYPAW